jgi:hypothetical protein
MIIIFSHCWTYAPVDCGCSPLQRLGALDCLEAILMDVDKCIGPSRRQWRLARNSAISVVLYVSRLLHFSCAYKR